MNRLSVWGKSEKIARKKSPRDFLKAFRLWERGAKRCKHTEKAARGLGMGRERRNSPLSSLPFILPIFSRSLTSTLLSGLSNGKFETARPGFPTSRLQDAKSAENETSRPITNASEISRSGQNFPTHVFRRAVLYPYYLNT